MSEHEQPVEPDEPVEDLELTDDQAEPVTGGARHNVFPRLSCGHPR
jgi:hypothetical protein